MRVVDAATLISLNHLPPFVLSRPTICSTAFVFRSTAWDSLFIASLLFSASSKSLLHKKIVAPHVWQYHVRSEEVDADGRKEGPNLRRLQNWSMQTSGSEMMRSAAIKLAQNNIMAGAVIHDAFLIIAPEDQIEKAVEITQELMAEASAEVLGGHPLKTDAEIFIYPERFPEPRGEAVWNMVQEFLEKHESKQAVLI